MVDKIIEAYLFKQFLDATVNIDPHGHKNTEIRFVN